MGFKYQQFVTIEAGRFAGRIACWINSWPDVEISEVLFQDSDGFRHYAVIPDCHLGPVYAYDDIEE